MSFGRWSKVKNHTVPVILVQCPGRDISVRDLTENAIHNNQDKDFNGAVLASDAFFPFNDCVKVAADAGIKAIVQPGGSIKDQDSIDLCNELNIPMVFTGYRHFRH